MEASNIYHIESEYQSSNPLYRGNPPNQKQLPLRDILDPDLTRVPQLDPRKPEKMTIHDVNEFDTDNIRRKMLMVDMHKKALQKHEPYLETNNKRPGPPLEQTENEKNELLQRRNYAWEKGRFSLTTHRLNLELLDWKKVLSVHAAKTSSSGVFFASQVHGAFVIKSCLDVVQCYFASLVFQKLQIPTPEIRVVPHYDKEFKFMLHSLERVSFYDDTLRYMIKMHMDRPFILLQEYIPAVSLHNMGQKRADRCFNVAFPDASNRLINIGKIIAADVVLNNPDRMPMIWDNHGNSTNLLFEISTDEKIDDEKLYNLDFTEFTFRNTNAIDNKCFCIKQNDRLSIGYLKEYLDRIEGFIEMVFQDLRFIINGEVAVGDYNYPSIKRILDFFYDHTLYRIEGRAAFRILEGIVIGLFNIQNEGINSIQESFQQIHQIIQKDWKNIWKIGCEEIEIDFFKLTIDVVDRLLTKYDEEVKWVLKTNLFTFVIDHVLEGRGNAILNQLRKEEEDTQLSQSQKFGQQTKTDLLSSYRNLQQTSQLGEVEEQDQDHDLQDQESPK